VELQGRTAIVTGGGSGIGAALTRALAADGVAVTCADLDLGAATRVAADLPGVVAVQLDVTDAAAVQTLIDGFGHLDLLFNNAGIAFSGETELLTLAQWNQIIDVNLRGVVHGVVAGYPKMIKQGSGQIVNTASMGGLMAAGLLTSYIATKHAVVGLSLALRSEAAAHGVGVTVVCPSAVETPILDKGAVGTFHGRDYYLKGQGLRHAYSADALAQDVLRAVQRNRAMVVAPRQARVAWFVGRTAPRLMQRMSILFVARQRRMMRRRTRRG
jgi:NAD(P)-dependent dehydrogenase (short-subunit alcohol dehydrogenase family)